MSNLLYQKACAVCRLFSFLFALSGLQFQSPSTPSLLTTELCENLFKSWFCFSCLYFFSNTGLQTFCRPSADLSHLLESVLMWRWICPNSAGAALTKRWKFKQLPFFLRITNSFFIDIFTFFYTVFSKLAVVFLLEIKAHLKKQIYLLWGLKCVFPDN